MLAKSFVKSPGGGGEKSPGILPPPWIFWEKVSRNRMTMKIFLVKIIYICSSKSIFDRSGHSPRPKFLSRNFCKNAILGRISVLFGSLLAMNVRGACTGVWVGENSLNIPRKHTRAVSSMCGQQALDPSPHNEGRNFCIYPIWGYLGPNMAKIWNFGNRPRWL